MIKKKSYLSNLLLPAEGLHRNGSEQPVSVASSRHVERMALWGRDKEQWELRAAETAKLTEDKENVEETG